MSAEFWKIEKDLCRCCHSEGTHKNLAEPCLEGGEEIYSEMLHETLDINISPVSGDLGTVTYTICEVCIMRLQDAWSFKQQVLQCENRFNDLYTRNIIKLEPDCVVVAVKEETGSDNEGFKEERIDDSDGDFEMTYGDGNNSDSDMDTQDTKAKPKAKPKAKSKATPKAPPKKKSATKTSTTKEAAEGQAVAKEKKDMSPSPEDLVYFTVIEEDNKKKYRCNKCAEVYMTLPNMRKHIDTHSQATRCESCAKEFSTLRKLSKHMLIHRRVQCPECPQMFLKTELPFHRADVHSVAMPTCGVCGYRSICPRQIVLHQRRVHMTEKTVPCPKCDMKFFAIGNLNQHLIRHNPVKKYQCKFCNKKFPRTETLRRHERIHTGEKRKICKLCGERFVQKASLNYHMLKYHPDAV